MGMSSLYERELICLMAMRMFGFLCGVYKDERVSDVNCHTPEQ